MDITYDHKNYIVDNFTRMPMDDQRRIIRDNIIANRLASLALQDNGTELIIKLEAVTDPTVIKNMYIAVSSICSKL
jgi:hypothetical protein